MARRKPEPANVRTGRLMALVPWLLERPGIELAVAAAQQGVSEAQLRKDLDLLQMCGYGPFYGEMIEVDYADGRVFLSNADTIPTPLRLDRDEAVSLILALETLTPLEEDEWAGPPGAGQTDRRGPRARRRRSRRHVRGTAARAHRTPCGDGAAPSRAPALSLTRA